MNEDEERRQLIHYLTTEVLQLNISYGSGLEYIHHVNAIIRMAQQLPHTIQ